MKEALMLILGGLLFIFAGYFLINTFLLKVDNLEPNIINLEQNVKIIGTSINTNNETAFKDIVKLKENYNDLRRKYGVPNRKEPWTFISLNYNFDMKKGEFSLFMGDIVTNFDNIPHEYQTFEIPVATYAVFPVRPKVSYLWSLTLARTKHFIYEKWLPNSSYEHDSFIGDFEWHDLSDLENPELKIDLYVPVKLISGEKKTARMDGKSLLTLSF